jgi:hypothetical protein
VESNHFLVDTEFKGDWVKLSRFFLPGSNFTQSWSPSFAFLGDDAAFFKKFTAPHACGLLAR